MVRNIDTAYVHLPARVDDFITDQRLGRPLASAAAAKFLILARLLDGGDKIKQYCTGRH